MNKRQIDRYFSVLSKLYPKKCRLILTGAAAGVLYGRLRSTVDVDFAARTADWAGFSKSVSETGLRTGIAAQFAEDIDRWSSITLLDYERHTFLYKRFGKIEVRLMEPAYWAIGKLSRHFDSDVQDMVKVFRKTATRWEDVASVAGAALKASPKSTACFQFRKQVERFFEHFGRKTWGRAFDKDAAISRFRQSAGIRL